MDSRHYTLVVRSKHLECILSPSRMLTLAFYVDRYHTCRGEVRERSSIRD